MLYRKNLARYITVIDIGSLIVHPTAWEGDEILRFIKVPDNVC